MTYNIVIGRNESDRKKFGEKGTILIGRSYVKMGQTTTLSNYVYMDVIKSHVVLVVGKRGCLTGDTQIYTSNGFKIIKDYNEKKDKIYSFNKEKKTFEWETAKLLKYPIKEELYQIETYDGQYLKLTKEHPLLVYNNKQLIWKKAEKIKIEDILIGIKSKNLIKTKDNKKPTQEKLYNFKIKKISKVSNINEVYDLNVPKNHSFIANGIISHNSGKSYSSSVITEGIIDLPKEISNNLSVIMLDTMGVFWTMKYPNEKDAQLLENWNLKSKGLEQIKVFTPIGMYEYSKSIGIPTDAPFSIKASELSGEDWRLAFELSTSHPVSIFIEKILGDLAEKRIENFNVEDIIKLIEEDKTFSNETKNEAINRFKSSKNWGLFSDEGTKIDVLINRGAVSVLDMSAYATSSGGWGIKALVVGLIAKKVFIERMLSRKLDEIQSIRTGYSYFKIKEETNEDQKPLVWFVLDECLTGDTIINTSLGKQKLIDIVNNNKHIEVSSYNPLTHNLEYKPITKVYKKGKQKVIELETETGKRIKCTKEHKIKTINGFQEAIIAEEVSISLVTQYSKNKDFIIARIFGSIIGDGYLNQKGTIVGFSGKGSEEDLIKIKEDLQELGFSSSKIQTRQTKSLITTSNGRTHEVNGTSQEYTSSTRCHAFFKEKGAPIGEKILTTFQIPKWLMESDKQIKAEFLSALFGADGTAPSISKACKRDFNPIRLSFNYLIQKEESALSYAKDLIRILKDLDIKGNKITLRKDNIRKDSNHTKKILITLSKETSNTIKFLETIGYKYCKDKEIRAKKWLLYLKAKKYEEEKTLKLKAEAIKLYKNNKLGKIKIARQLKVKSYQVRDWIYYNKKTRSANSFPNFEEWIKKRTFENQIFEQITKKIELGIEEVFDISVKDNNTFIANDFIVHNCHELLPAIGKTAATDALVTILREGRQPGISLLLITQQPGKIHSDVLTQSDIVLAHRLTAKLDVDAFNSMMQSYLGDTLTSFLNILPSDPGAAIILDDNSERLYPIQIRPKVSWHGGESPTAIKFERSQNLGL